MIFSMKSGRLKERSEATLSPPPPPQTGSKNIIFLLFTIFQKLFNNSLLRINLFFLQTWRIGFGRLRLGLKSENLMNLEVCTACKLRNYSEFAPDQANLGFAQIAPRSRAGKNRLDQIRS